MNTEMASTLGSYHKNELYVLSPQLLGIAGCLIKNIEHFE